MTYKSIYKIGLSLFCCLLLISAGVNSNNSNSYKCMIQLVNYTGEGAYIIVSVLDSDDNYKETLRVIGKDEDWYPDLTEWYAYHEKSGQAIDGISGATISGGERAIFSFDIDEKYIDSNFKLRIETAVEDQEYHKDDIRLPILSNATSEKIEGTGYIRYMKLLKQ